MLNNLTILNIKKILKIKLICDEESILMLAAELPNSHVAYQLWHYRFEGDFHL